MRLPRLRGPRALQGLQEALGVLEADHARAVDLAARASKKIVPGRAEQAGSACSSSRSSALLRGHVGLQQQRAARACACTCRVAEGEALHLLARDAPVGIEVEHHRPARRCAVAASSSATLRTGVNAQRARWRRRAPRARWASGCSGSVPPEAAPTSCSSAEDRQHAATRRACASRTPAPPRCDATAAAADRAADQQRAPQRRAPATPAAPAARSRPPPPSSSRPNSALHVVHPGAGLRQQRAGRRADQQQRHAHAGGQREQRRAAEQHVARLAQVDQRAGQRRGDAGADDQRRHAAHREHAGQAAPAGQPLRRRRRSGAGHADGSRSS